MKYKYWAFGLSFFLIMSGIVNIFFGKGLKLGIDFAGGTLIRVKFAKPVVIDDIRSSLRDVGLGDSVIQEIGREKQEYNIRTKLPEEQTEQELEAHEIMGNRVIEALETKLFKISPPPGLKDLNTVDENELTFLLEPDFPEKAPEIARQIVNFRVSEGIIEDSSQLEKAGISQEVVSRLKEKTYIGPVTVLSRETVGPQVGKDLRKKATLATVWALMGMLVYIALRFRFGYGVSAILTLTHDVLVTLGIFSFTNREINLPVIAAVLTIVGYSLNDTIVIFDRVRENVRSMRKQSLEEILNLSVNQTLSRSIITSGTVFLTVMALFLFGGEVINDFAFTMLVGVISGSYSTIYQSCPIVYFWQKIFKTTKGFRKR